MTTHTKTLRAALCASLLTLAVACGDDETPQQVDPTDNNTAGTNNGNNTTPEPDPDPVPFLLLASVSPPNAVYGLGSTISLEATVVDITDEPLDVEVVWSADVAAAASFDAAEGTVTFAQEGPLVLSACTVLPGPDGEPVCDVVPVLVDDAPPTIEILSPLPGAELSGEDSGAITVEGVVTDTHGEVAAWLNGEPLTLAADGSFQATISPRFGVEHIEVVATDGLHDEPSTSELDVLWAPAYYATNETTEEASVDFADGVILNLGQNFFDDGVKPITSPEGAVFTEDLSDVLLLVLRNLDLGSLVSNPVLDSGDLRLSLQNLTMGDPRLNIEITDDGLELFLSVPNLSLDTVGAFDVFGSLLDLTGRVEVAASIVASVSITKPQGQPIDVELTNIAVAIEGAQGSFVDPETAAIFALAESGFRTQLESVLVGILEESFLDSIPTLLEEALGSLEQGLLEQRFDLDFSSVGLGQATVRFGGAIDTLENQARRSLELRVGLGLAAELPPVLTSRGVALAAPNDGRRPDLFATSRAQIAIRLGALNSLLHSVWRVGLLNVDATALIPDAIQAIVSEASMVARMPPVIVPPARGEDADLLLRLGQVELTAKVTRRGLEQVITYGATIDAAVRVGIQDNELAVDVADDPQLRVWVISIEGDRADSPFLDADQLRGLIVANLWPVLTDALGEGLSIPLPVLDLGDLSGFAPALAGFTLVFDQVRELVSDNEYLIVDARLRGTLLPF
jgi:hypothetical protein